MAFILVWLACLVAVIAAVTLLTGGEPPKPHTVPSTAALAVKALLGWMAFRQRRHVGRLKKLPAWMAHLDRLSMWMAAGLGVVLQPWGLVAAGAAMLVQSKLYTAGDRLTLVLFCLRVTSSLLATKLYTAFAPVEAGARLGRLQKWINHHTDQAIVTASPCGGGLIRSEVAE